MSRFKRLRNKSNKKSSILIDEKISLLNKELKKTGMLSEMMTTDKIYSTSTHVPPQERIEGDVPNSSGIGQGGFTQNSASSGNDGDPPSFSDISQLFNSDINTSILRGAFFGGTSGYAIVIGPSFGAGTTYGILTDGNIYRAVLGGHLAGGTRGPNHYEKIYLSYLEVNQNSPGFYSQQQIDDALENWQLAVQVHAALVDIGFDNSRFNIPWQGWRRPILFEDLSGFPSFAHESKGTLFLVPFNLLGGPNTYTIQNAEPRGHTNVLHRGFEDDPIYPGSIPPGMFPPLSDPAYNELRRRAEEERKRQEEEERRRKEKEERNRKEEEEEEEDGPLVYGMTQEEVDRKFGHLDADGLAEEGIIRNPDGSYREMTDAEKKAFKDKRFKEGLKKIAYNAGVSYSVAKRIFDTINPLGKKLDDILKGDSGVKELDKLLDPIAAAFGKGIASRAFKGKFKTPANVMFRYDKWLASGAKGRVDVTNEISTSDMKKLSSKLHNYSGKSPDWWVNYYQNLPKTNTNYAATREDALMNLSDDIQRNMDSIMREGGSGLSMTFQNNVQLDRAKFIASGGKTIELTKTYKFSERTGSVKGFSNTVLGQLLMGMGVELDRFGTGGIHNTIITLLGSKYGLRAVNRQYGGKADRAPGMPMKIRIPSNVTESVGSFDAYMNSTNLLTEDVGLGLYEPVAMNVDLADIRKGVMPEYPKKPPAKMIDGYHQDSKLKPKKFKDKYLLKLDKKDLLRNHRLKKSEVDEMMNTIKMINDYLKKHPEDLIHVQQRYPIDDPRLAELNWKMDQMLQAGEEYMDSNFKENQILYKRAMDRTKNNIRLTDPEYIQQKYDELRGTVKPKKSINKRNVSRFFKKPTKKKSSMEEIDDKIKQLDKDLLI